MIKKAADAEMPLGLKDTGDVSPVRGFEQWRCKVCQGVGQH